MRLTRTRRGPAATGAGARGAGARGAWRLCLVCVLLSAATPAFAQRQPYVSYVLELHGRWLVRQNQLSRGDRLQAEDRVYVESPTHEDYIVVVNRSGGRVARHCRVAADCAQPLLIRREAPPRPGAVKVVVESVMHLLFGEHGMTVAIRSRGEGSLLDEVAELRGGRADLGKSFRALPADRYVLTMQRLGRGGKAVGRPLQTKINWDPNAPAALSGRGLRPGLYEIALHRPMEGGGTMPSGVSAWVLLSGPRTFKQAAAAHEDARALTESWGDAVSAESARDFMRAHLAHLAGWGAK